MVLLHVVFFSFRFSISSLKTTVCRGLSSLLWHKICKLCLYVACLRHFLTNFLYPSILSIMFCLLTVLDDFRGAKVSCRWGPELSSEQRLELFEISLSLLKIVMKVNACFAEQVSGTCVCLNYVNKQVSETD